MPGVLVCHEKHSTDIYWALTIEQLHIQCLNILQDRFGGGWYYEPRLPEKPEMSLEQIKALPEGKIKKAALQVYQRWQRQHRSYLDEKASYDAIVTAIESHDGEAAWKCLRERSDGEYESIELVQPYGELDGILST